MRTPQRNYLSDDEILTLARNYDLQNSSPLTDSALIRSTAQMERIMATDPRQPDPQALTRNPGRQPVIEGLTRNLSGRWALRLAAIPVAAALIIAAVTMLPVPGVTPQAFATWTAVPTAVPADLIDFSTSVCRVRMWDTGQGQLPSRDELATPADFVEMRGDFVTAVFNSVAENPTVCVTQVIDGRPQVRGMWTLGDSRFNSGFGSMSLWSSSWNESGALEGEPELPITEQNVVSAMRYAESWIEGEGAIAILLLRVDPSVAMVSVNLADQSLNGREARSRNNIANARNDSDPDHFLLYSPDGKVRATLVNSLAFAWWPLQNDLHWDLEEMPQIIRDHFNLAGTASDPAKTFGDVVVGGSTIGGSWESTMATWGISSKLDAEVASIYLLRRGYSPALEISPADLPRSTVMFNVRQYAGGRVRVG
jgi:hypothetical protein